MATDYYLKIDGIEGESKADKHTGEIEVMSFSWGATQTGTASHGSGMGAGKVSMHDLAIVKKTDKSSPKLMLACATGDHIKKVVLSCNKAGGSKEEYMKITLSDVLISSYQASGSHGGDEIPTDQVSLNFSKIEYEYKEQKESGQVGGAVKAGWDVKLNKKV